MHMCHQLRIIKYDLLPNLLWIHVANVYGKRHLVILMGCVFDVQQVW